MDPGMGSKKTPARLLCFFSLALFFGCEGWDGGAEAPLGESDSLQGPLSPAVDTLRAGEAEADPGPTPQDPTSPGLQDTSGTAAQLDTTVPSLTELNARVQTLEEENDSLRIALRTLIELSRLNANQGLSADSTASDPEEIIQVDGERVRNWGLRTLVAVLLLAATGLVVRALAWVLEKLAERSAKRRLVLKRLIPILRIFIWAFAAFFIVRVIFSVGGQELLAAGAAVGVAVGFAAQDILKNVFGGLIVLFDQPFQVGDKVSVGGTYGEVVNIGLRSTRIVTPDDNLVTVPNAQVVDGQVANANAGELNCQVVTDLYLPGWVDEVESKKIAFDAAASSKYVYLNKPIVVLVKDKFEDTFLTHLKVKAYVLDPRYEFLFMSDVTERARKGFRKAGLLGPMHGVRAYVDLDRFPDLHRPEPLDGDEEPRGESGGEGEGETTP
jgi:small-conductance mechanosensitive channel